MTRPSNGHAPARRVFLVEDNAIVRRGIHLLLGMEPDLVMCGEAEDAEEAFEQICELRPDLAIVDLTLAEGSGLELIPRVRVECPQVRILVLSMHDQRHWMEMALLAGAEGYLTKDESPDQLIHAIRQILAGKRFLSERGLMRLGNKMTSGWLTSGQLQDPAPPVEGPTASPSPRPSAPKSVPRTPPPRP